MELEEEVLLSIQKELMIFMLTHLIKHQIFLHYGDLTDSLSIFKLIDKILPDEIYNLAAQSHVHVSFEVPEYTSNVTALGTLRILDTLKTLKDKKRINFTKPVVLKCMVRQR